MTDVFVLGNGPSLRGVDLHAFSGVPTIGMNAAYRHWERIDWYPTHYCCLDDELVETHHDAIAALLDERRVATAFVTARFVQLHPDFANDERCHVFERFHRPSFDAHGRSLGLRFEDHAAFRASEPWKVTTGAYAVRYGIFLGYRRLHLVGIDCNYVATPAAVNAVGGLALELAETPATNPNYFFDDYQREGDRYQVPNPPIYGPNLHLQSLQLVCKDVCSLRLPADIRVCSSRSELVVRGVFPYERLRDAVAEAGGAPELVAEDSDTTPVSPRPGQASAWTPPPPSRYDRVYLWTMTRSRPLFLAGRATMRVVRAIRRRRR